MSSNIYNIVYSKVVQWLTPAAWRKPVHLAWLKVCVNPVEYVYNNLLRFRSLTLYQLSITPQVCYLERLLNDRYDWTQRRIWISDALDADPLYIYQDAEEKPVYIYLDGEGPEPPYLYTDGEASDLKDDFIVNVPYGITFNPDEMSSLIKQYKLGSKTFKIVRV